MKQITKKEELVSYTKIYLISHHYGGAHLANWTPKYGDDFSTKDGRVINYDDTTCIVELCDDTE